MAIDEDFMPILYERKFEKFKSAVKVSVVIIVLMTIWGTYLF